MAASARSGRGSDLAHVLFGLRYVTLEFWITIIVGDQNTLIFGDESTLFVGDQNIFALKNTLTVLGSKQFWN